MTLGRKRLVLCDWRLVEFNRWAELEVQGKGVRMYKAYTFSNSWLVEDNFRLGSSSAKG